MICLAGIDMFKRLLRAGIRKTRSWLREDEALQPDWLSGYAYGRLNESLEELLREGPSVRPHFAWGLLHAAFLAKTLGIRRISSIEFGVAGGNGLLSMEHLASAIGSRVGVEIDVHGFDTGVGLPQPEDYRDLPNLFRETAFVMDPDRLRKRLKKAQLHLGLAEHTVKAFIESSPAPVGFISFDMDYYSSTMRSFELFEADHQMLLPRIHCYFDDIIGFTYSEFTGERLAITEFNNSHAMAKISPIFGLRHFVPSSQSQQSWIEQMFMTHIFDHKLYANFDGLALDDKSTNLAAPPE